MTYNVLMGTLNPTHSFTHLLITANIFLSLCATLFIVLDVAKIFTLALAAMQCIVIGRVCLWVGGCVCGWVCYHDSSKLHAAILTKLGL